MLPHEEKGQREQYNSEQMLFKHDCFVVNVKERATLLYPNVAF